MQDLVLISSLNSQNSIVSNTKMSHCVALLVGELGIEDVLWTFSLMFFWKNIQHRSISPYNVDVEKDDSEVWLEPKEPRMT